MKTINRIIYSFCVMSATTLLLWSCANDYARTDITLEMTDEDSVDAIIDHDLLTVGGTIINIEEPQETHTPVVEYIDEVDITTPEFDDDDIATDVAEVKLDDASASDDDVMESVEIDDSNSSDDLVDIDSRDVDDSILYDNTDDIIISDGKEISAVLEEPVIDKNVNLLEDKNEHDEPMKIEDIIVADSDSGFSVPSDEEVAKLRNDVDALINKQGNKKQLDQFVSPVYNDKRVKVTYPTHIVSRGDTLWSIGRKYGCSISELCAANNISRRKVLSIGQSLIIPISNLAAAKSKPLPKNISSVSSDLEMPPPVTENPKTNYDETEFYTVQKGDSYWKIARKYGVNSPELMRINNTTSTLIKPGQKIKVPKR